MNHQQTTTWSSNLPVIIVFGCTGTVGSEVMRQLASHKCFVRGVLRKSSRRYPIPLQEEPARVSYVTVDHNSVDHLARVCRGADTLFLLIGTHPEQVRSEFNIIEAAKKAGIRRIIKMSAPVIDESILAVEVATWHREIEAKLADSGIEHCNLRPYAFMQNWLRSTHTITHFGKIFGSANTSPRNYVDCRDVATVAVRLLLQEEPLNANAISITGPEAISNQEMAERISLVTGSNVLYKNLSKGEHYQMLIKRAKLPKWLAQHIVDLEELAVLIPEKSTDTVEALLGCPPRTMDEFLQEFRPAFMKKSWIPDLRNLSQRPAILVNTIKGRFALSPIESHTV